MKKHRNFRFYVLAGLVLMPTGMLLAQSGAANKTLIVNGKSTETMVRQLDGRSYIDVEVLAQLTSGTVFIEPTRVVLTIPVSNSAAAPAVAVVVAPAPAVSAPVAPAAGAPVAVNVPADSAAPAATIAAAEPAPAPAPTPSPVQQPQGLSRGFASAAIATLADMREWRGATAAMITHGLALGDAWAQSYRDQSQADLAQAEVAATTDADRNALALLRNEADNLMSWSNGVLAARQDLNGAATIDPDALKNDSALAKIRACSQFLNSMLVSGSFGDDASCH
ncbi:MAG TPA: hypothetical protein VN881_04315 [Candidatus Acidoferrales bacterium]|nr:hypothetical protein [Candidatus Acidoferrales bacterium]